MSSVCKRFSAGTLPAAVTNAVGTVTITSDLRDVAATFVTLQDERHVADYDLAARFTRNGVLTLLRELDNAFEAWARVRDDETSRLFLMMLPLSRELQR
jgi:hypothetical protein